ncbi:MAG TPA: helix-turn-helix domain-containing protein [Longimicrobiaceae bacterium]|nr:helix-turn-helix domain-containing protein [Longimicrobiaceae bacterium]
MRRSNTRRVIVLDSLRLRGLEGVEHPYSVAPAVAWTEVEELVGEAPPSAVVLLDPYAGPTPGELFPRLRDLLRRFPSLTVVAALELRGDRVGDLLTLLDWGVAEVIDAHTEATPRAIGARLGQAHARPLKRRLQAALSSYVSTEAHAVLLAAAEVAVEGGGAPELARVLRAPPRALAARFARADLPPPRQVQAWMRVLLACLLLDDPGRTVYAAAYACGYSTDRSLRRAVTELLGTDTTALRRGGAFAHAARAFDGLLAELREAGRERRRAARMVPRPG